MDDMMRPNYTVQMTTQYMCSFCGEVCRSQPEMELHVSTHIRGMAPSSSSCNVCGKSYNTASKLRRHVRTHSGEKPYPCRTCGRCFGRSDHLKQHMKVHAMTSKRQKNLCRLCGMMFLKIDTLLAHLNEHGILSAQNCTYCGEVFGSAERLEEHEKGHVKTQEAAGKVGELKLEAPDVSQDVLESWRTFPLSGESAEQDTAFSELMLGVASQSAKGHGGPTDSNAYAESSTSSVPSSMINFAAPICQLPAAAFPKTFAHEFRVIGAQSTTQPALQMELAGGSSCSPHSNFALNTVVKKDIDDSETCFSAISGQVSVSSEQDTVALADDADTGPEVRDTHVPTRHCRRKHRMPRKCKVSDALSDDDDSARVPSEDGSVRAVEGAGVGENLKTDLGHQRLFQSDQNVKEMSTLDIGRAVTTATNINTPDTIEVDKLHSSTPCSSADPSPGLSNQIAANSHARRRLWMHRSEYVRTSSSRMRSQKTAETSGKSSSRCSTSIARGLLDEARVTGPDLPGLGRSFRCDPCRTWFEDYSMYLLHNSLHTRGGQTPFACLHCGKVMGNRLEFTAHLIWHLSPDMDRP